MKLPHRSITGNYCQIECTQDKNFPKHSAVMFLKREGRQGYILARMHATQKSAIADARNLGYIVPVGF
jgi:hypothetical protein